METKPATVNFFRVNSRSTSKVKSFVDKLEEVHQYFEQEEYERIATLEINQDKYYIQAMQKRTLESNHDGKNFYYWLITISRVNIGEDIIIADLSKRIDRRRRTVDQGDAEGLVVDTRIVFDPFRLLLLSYNQRGTINNADLKRFICKLVDVRGIMLEVVLNKDGYNRLNNLDLITEVTYKVASPNKFNAFSDDSRSEHGDLKFAKVMSSDELYITLKSNGLNKRSIVSKVHELFSKEDIEVKSMRVDGINDGVRDPIELIKNKLDYKGFLEFEEVVDDHAVYGLLNKAYDTHEEYLHSIYHVVQFESE